MMSFWEGESSHFLPGRVLRWGSEPEVPAYRRVAYERK